MCWCIFFLQSAVVISLSQVKSSRVGMRIANIIDELTMHIFVYTTRRQASMSQVQDALRIDSRCIKWMIRRCTALRCVMRSEHVSGRKFLSYVDRIMYGDSNAAMVCCKSIKFERYGHRSRHGRGRHRHFLSWIFKALLTFGSP